MRRHCSSLLYCFHSTRITLWAAKPREIQRSGNVFLVNIIVKGTDCRSTQSSVTLTASLLGVFSRGTSVSASMVPMQKGIENGSEARSPDRIIICVCSIVWLIYPLTSYLFWLASPDNTKAWYPNAFFLLWIWGTSLKRGQAFVSKSKHKKADPGLKQTQALIWSLSLFEFLPSQ